MGSLYAIILPIMTLVGLIAAASYYLKLDPMIAKVALGIGAFVVFVVTMVGLFRRLRLPKGEGKVDPEKAARRQLRAAMRAEEKALRRRLRAFLADVRATDRELRARGIGARPWWLVVGPPGHGKSRLLAAAPASRELAGEAGAPGQPRFFSTEAGVFIEIPADYERRSASALAFSRLMQGIRAARPQQPVVGILVVRRIDASSPRDPATTAELGELRGQIDRLCRELAVQAPITLMATQLDRLAGFADLCADQEHVDTRRALGVTLDPRATSDTVQASAIARLAADDGPLAWLEMLCHVMVVRSQPAPERQSRLYGLWQRLGELSRDAGAIAGELAATPLPGGDPLPVRGIYFTCAEGRVHPEPDGFFDRLAREAGGALPASSEPPPAPPPQAFVSALFTTELARDSAYGARLGSHRRRVQALRGASAAALVLIGASVAVSATRSVAANRRLLEETGTEAHAMLQPANGPVEPLRSPDQLTPLRQLVDLWRSEDPPEGYGWGLFRSDLVADAVLHAYRGAVCRRVLRPLVERTEEELRRFAQEYGGGGVPTSVERDEGFRRLRFYLLLSRAERPLDGEPPRWGTHQSHVIAEAARMWAPQANDAEARSILETHAALVASTLGGAVGAGDPCLQSAGERAIKRDDELVRRVQELLYRSNDERETVDRLIHTINSQRNFRPVDLVSLTRASHLRSRGGLEVQGAFTRAGWDEFSRLVAGELVNGSEGDSWVRGPGPSQLSRDERCQRLVALYVDRYVSAWKRFLEDLSPDSPASVLDASAIYRDLSDHKPLTAVFEAIDAHTQRLRAITCAVDPIDKVPEKWRQWATPPTTADAPPEVGKNARYLAGEFDRLLDLAIAPSDPGSPAGAPRNVALETYHDQLAQLRQAADQAIENSAREEDLSLALDNALNTSSTLIKAARLGTWEDRVAHLLMPPLRSLKVVLDYDAAMRLNEEWCQQVVKQLRWKAAGRYPFDPAARTHASLDDLLAVFHPETGEIAHFRDNKLGGYVTVNGDKFETQELGAEAKLHLNPAVLQLLDRANHLGHILFRDGEASVDFSMEMTCDRRINKVELSIDESPHVYLCTTNQRREVHWPGKGPTHLTQVVAHSTTTKAHEYKRAGVFGLFQLMEEVGAPRLEASGAIVLTFDMRSYGNITVRLRPRGSPSDGTIFYGVGADRFLAPFRASGFVQPPTTLFTEHPYSCPDLEGP